eukprot:TRINITY_DN8859_c0_g3_i1.p1 TRINITY_DN8859_c0_g3~~TRINITY_DN8859_c0_g3_i1.p1  ORF type:complete len:342 (+),score=79.63 TRINITY_DN8859_c0_g3_i1:69-1094(+)
MEAGRGPEAAPAAAGPPPVYQVVGIDVVFACVTTYWQPSAKEWRDFAAVCLPFARVAKRALGQSCELLECLRSRAHFEGESLTESGVVGALRALAKHTQHAPIIGLRNASQLCRWVQITEEVILLHGIMRYKIFNCVRLALTDAELSGQRVAAAVWNAEHRKAGATGSAAPSARAGQRSGSPCAECLRLQGELLSCREQLARRDAQLARAQVRLVSQQDHIDALERPAAEGAADPAAADAPAEDAARRIQRAWRRSAAVHRGHGVIVSGLPSGSLFNADMVETLFFALGDLHRRVMDASNGTATVWYEHRGDADLAIRKMHGRLWRGSKLTVRSFRGPSPP